MTRREWYDKIGLLSRVIHGLPRHWQLFCHPTEPTDICRRIDLIKSLEIFVKSLLTPVRRQSKTLLNRQT